VAPKAHSLFILSVLVAGTCSLAGCGDLGPFDRYREDFHFSQAFQPNGRLEVENFNGSVDVASWDRNTIDVSGTKYAPSKDQMDRLKIDFHVDGGIAYVKVQRQDSINWGGGYGAKFLIRVPKATALSRVKTTNGGVTVEDVDGGGHVLSTNGRVLLARVNGDYDLETTNGGIELDQCQGAIRAHTTNGSVRGQLSAGAINAGTTNGPIDVTLRKTKRGDPLRVETTNGSVTLIIGELNDNEVSASSTNGSITLRLPSSPNARLEARNSTSSITNEVLPFAVEDQSKHRLTGKFGDGGPLIQLHTSNGGIHILKY
jgi:Putative adhesin